MTILFKNIKYLNYSESIKIFQLENAMSIRDALLNDNIPLEMIKTVTFMVNGVPERSDYLLKENDQVTVIPVITGG